MEEAWVKDPAGKKIIDFSQHNLHLLNYSVPIRQKMNVSELRHIWILYRINQTSYYQEHRGFCLPHRQYEQLEEGTYEVCINSRLEAGHLTYGELFIPGQTTEEVLFSAHICHPSLANDNLSGINLLTYLGQLLSRRENR